MYVSGVNARKTAFVYDSAGNMKFEYSPGANDTTEHRIDAASNRQTRLTGPGCEFDYYYDANGNLRERHPRPFTTCVGIRYWYDVMNRLIKTMEVTDPERFFYDGMGRLVRRNVIAGAANYFYDGANVASYSGVDFLHGPGVDDPLIAFGNPGICDTPSAYFVTHGTRLFDFHGRTGVDCTSLAGYTEWANQAGATRNSFSYDLSRAGGDQADVQSFFRNRFYDARMNRFIQEDPFGFAGGLNLYSYAENNPATYTDPFGLCPWCLPLLGRAAVGAAMGVGEGYAITKLLGGDYGVKDFFWDAALGAVGGGVTKAAALRRGAEAAEHVTFGSKILKQMSGRGWSEEAIRDVIRNPARTVSTRDVRFLPGGGRMNDAATAFIDEAGGYVIRNNRTGDIVQISNRLDPNWISPF